ncbi:MAG: transposase [Treponema sp.]|nr:transposase [Treponema sp.]
MRSSRRLKTECRRNLKLLWPFGKLSPDHKTIAEFRRRKEPASWREWIMIFARLRRRRSGHHGA